MCRRFRRFRRLAHQVVEVTRRIWRVCRCCGTVNEESHRDIVPLASVVSGAVTRRSLANNQEVLPFGLCCFVPHRTYIVAQNGGCPSVRGHLRIKSSVTDLQLEDEKDGPGRTPSSISHPIPYVHNVSNISQTDDVEAMKFYDHKSEHQEAEHPHQGDNSIKQTDDFVPMRFFYDRDSPNIDHQIKTDTAESTSYGQPSKQGTVTSQTDDIVPSRLYDQCSAGYFYTPKLPNSDNSQSDDFDSVRYYDRFPLLPDHSLGKKHEIIANSSGPCHQVSDTSQIHDKVPMRFYGKPSSVNGRSTCPDHGNFPRQTDFGRSNTDTSQADDHVPMLFYGRESPKTKPKPHGILRIRDQRHSTRQCHQTSVSRPKRTVHFQSTVQQILYTPVPWNEPLQVSEERPATPTQSGTVCLGHRPSANLTVEFAKEQLWHSICPSDLPLQERLYSSATSRVDLVTAENLNREIVVKTMTVADSELESKLLIECQCSRVVQLWACYVLGDMRYLCMSYYERRDLSVWLVKDRKRYYIRENAATLICAYVLVGLEFLHSKNILHLNVKPSNILIDDGGFPVLADFGKARRRLMRQPLDSPGRLDDIRGLACVLYEAVTRIVPPSEDNPSEDLDLSMLTHAASNFVGFHLTRPRRERRMMRHRCDQVMGHTVFGMIDWQEVKNSRSCCLNRLFSKMERDEWIAKHTPDLLPDNPFLPECDRNVPTSSTDTVNERPNPSAQRATPWVETPTPSAETPTPSAERPTPSSKTLALSAERSTPLPETPIESADAPTQSA